MISAKGIKGGARASYELKKTFIGVVKVHLKAYFEIGGFVSFEKPQIGGYIAAGGTIDVDVWIIGISLSLDALFSVEVPEPFKIYAKVKVRVCAKLLFVKKCFKFEIELNWERNDVIDRTPIAPLPHVNTLNQIDRTDEAVKGVNMLSNDSFELNKFPVIEDMSSNWEPNAADIDKILPLDTYVDIKTTKGLIPVSVWPKIGGYTNPPSDYEDLIPPEKIVRGMEIRQVKHQYYMDSFDLKAWNGTSWVNYQPHVAALKDEDPATLASLRVQAANLPIGYWQKSGQQYSAIRLLATNPFSYTEQGEPGWFVPEQYGITPSSLFCEGVERAFTCCDVLNKPLGTTYYPPTQMNAHYINGAYFTLEIGEVGYITLNFDGSHNEVSAENNFVIDETANPFGFDRSLRFENGNSLVIFLPSVSAEVKLKLTTSAERARIKFYKSVQNSSTIISYVLVSELYLNQAELQQEVHFVDLNNAISKITVTPDYIDLDAVNMVTGQIADLVGVSYSGYIGNVTGLNPTDQAAYDGLIADLDRLLGNGCGARKDGAQARGDKERENCVTSLQEICWLSESDAQYNEIIPGQDAINQDSQDMQAAIQNQVQPIWRPNTSYYLRFRLRDIVDNGEAQKTYDYFYGFKTVGPVGHYHLHPEVEYLPQGAKPEEFPLTSLRRYIDYRRSYPNADGNLLLAKPIFYANRQCKITLFFSKPLTSNMLNKWYAYNGLPDIEGALHIAIKDPISEVTIPYPLPIDFEEASVPVPENGGAWNSDSEMELGSFVPLNIQALNEQIEQGNTDPDMECELVIGEPLVPYSEFYQAVLTNLQPQKLYTALFYNAFDKNASNSLETAESEEVHQYVFQTSRYPNFRIQVESYKLRELDATSGGQIEKNAVFPIEVSVSANEISSAYSLIDPATTPDAVAKALAVKYQHHFDRVVEGIFGIIPINPPETTEFNLLVNSLSDQVIAILIKNPEPFNNPNMPLVAVYDTIAVLNGSGDVDDTYKQLYSKDFSQVILMHSTKIISPNSLDFRFQYKSYNGVSYSPDVDGLDSIDDLGNLLNEVVVQNIEVNS